jgi:hypothetical protein
MDKQTFLWLLRRRTALTQSSQLGSSRQEEIWRYIQVLRLDLAQCVV